MTDRRNKAASSKQPGSGRSRRAPALAWLMVMVLGSGLSGCSGDDDTSGGSDGAAADVGTDGTPGAEVMDTDTHTDTNTDTADTGGVDGTDGDVSVEDVAELFIPAAAGGSLTSPDGNASITVPADALGNDTTVRVEQVDPPDDTELLSAVYDFGPDGTSFQTPATICLAASSVPEGRLCLAWYDGARWICGDNFPTVTDDGAGGGMVCGKTDHFTQFAVVIGLNTTKEEPVTPLDAVLESAEGGSRLIVGEGAVTESIKLEVTPQPKAPGNGEPVSMAYDYGPDGTTFEKDVTICIKTELEAEGHCLGYYEEKDQEWVCEDTCLKKESGELCGETDHFTSFAILLKGEGDNDVCDGDVNTAVIDANGGSVTSPDGLATFKVPAGAIKEPTTFQIGLVADPGSDTPLGSGTYDIGPNGTQFAKPAKVCLTTNGEVDDKACLGTFDEEQNTWTCEDKCLEKGGENFVCGETDHLTNFAVLLTGGSSDACDNDAVISAANGGTATSDDGEASVSVPAGALSADTAITITKVDGVPSDDGSILSTVYEFGPKATFLKTVIICLKPNDGVSVGGGTCLGFLKDDVWECADECLEKKDESYCGTTSHFTPYALRKAGAGCQ